MYRLWVRNDNCLENWKVYCKKRENDLRVLLNLGLKFSFQQGRPDDVSHLEIFGYTLEWVSYSFPSGHAMRAFLFFGLMIYIVWSFVQNQLIRHIFHLLFALLILLIGMSRVILEAHFPSDIFAAFIISLAWLTLCIAVFQMIQNKKEQEQKNYKLLSRS